MITKSQGISLSYPFYALQSQAGVFLKALMQKQAFFNHWPGLSNSMAISNTSSDKSEHMSSENSEDMPSRKLCLQLKAMLIDDLFSSQSCSSIESVSGHGRIWMHHSDVTEDCSDFSQISQFPRSNITNIQGSLLLQTGEV